MKQFENELYFEWIDDKHFRSELTKRIKSIVKNRIETQNDINTTLGISLTKIKQIEKGTCKDFNAINNYINYFGKHLITNKIPF